METRLNSLWKKVLSSLEKESKRREPQRPSWEQEAPDGSGPISPEMAATVGETQGGEEEVVSPEGEIVEPFAGSVEREEGGDQDVESFGDMDAVALELAEMIAPEGGRAKEYKGDVMESMSLSPEEKLEFDALMSGRPSLMMEALGGPAMEKAISKTFDDSVSIPANVLDKYRKLTEKYEMDKEYIAGLPSPIAQMRDSSEVRSLREQWKQKMAAEKDTEKKRKYQKAIDNLSTVDEKRAEMSSIEEQRKQIRENLDKMLSAKYESLSALLPHRSELDEKADLLEQKIKDATKRLKSAKGEEEKAKITEELRKLHDENYEVHQAIEDRKDVPGSRPESAEYRNKKMEEAFPSQKKEVNLEDWLTSADVLAMSPEQKFEGKSDAEIMGIMRLYDSEILNNPELFGPGLAPGRGHLPSGGAAESEQNYHDVVARDLEYIKKNYFNAWKELEEKTKKRLEDFAHKAAMAEEGERNPTELPGGSESSAEASLSLWIRESLLDWHGSDSSKISIASRLSVNSEK